MRKVGWSEPATTNSRPGLPVMISLSFTNQSRSFSERTGSRSRRGVLRMAVCRSMVISSFVDDEAAQGTGGAFGVPVSISLRFTKGHQADERLAASISRLRRSLTRGFRVAPQVHEWFGGCRLVDCWALGGLAVVQRLIQRAGQPPQKEDGDQRQARTDGSRVHDGTWLGRPASHAAKRTSRCVAWRALICSLTHCGFLASCLATQSGCALISAWIQSG